MSSLIAKVYDPVERRGLDRNPWLAKMTQVLKPTFGECHLLHNKKHFHTRSEEFVDYAMKRYLCLSNLTHVFQESPNVSSNMLDKSFFMTYTICHGTTFA